MDAWSRQPSHELALLTVPVLLKSLSMLKKEASSWIKDEAFLSFDLDGPSTEPAPLPVCLEALGFVYFVFRLSAVPSC